MATKKVVKPVVSSDLMSALAILERQRNEFEATAAGIVQQAHAAIAEKIAEIQSALDEIQVIANRAGISDLDFDDVFHKVDNLRDEFNGGWNSSSC